MSRRALAGFMVLNVVVSLVVAGLVISIDRTRRSTEPKEGPTQIVILTATPLGGSALQPVEYQGTIDALQLTSTALASQAEIVAVITATPNPQQGGSVVEVTAVATIDPALLPPIPTDLPPDLATETADTPEDDGCIRHVIAPGDTISALALRYGVFAGDILLANDMTEDDAFNLQIGQVLVIPVEGCAALLPPTPVPTATHTPFSLTPFAPTVTLAPTAANAQVVIASVMNWGNVNSEMVEIRNVGNVINLQGWTLSNERGETFRFPEFRMQQGSPVRVYSRQGQNTPAALYWGRETPAWQEGEVITLADSTGQVQATFRVGETAPLFQEATLAPSP